jgi:type IV secretion system protein VirB10
MKTSRSSLTILFLLGSVLACAAQSHDLPRSPNACDQARESAAAPCGKKQLIVPAGTTLLLTLRNGISTKNAKVGDGVYLESSFPVAVEGGLAIPAGSFIEGKLARIKRPGRISGRGELEIHLQTLILRNGYMVSLSGAVESADSDEKQTVVGKEGTVKAPGGVTQDAATVLATTNSGAYLGLLSLRPKGVAIGTGAGAAAGIAAVLLTRGPDVRLAPGTSVEVVLQRPIVLDKEKIPANAQPQTSPTNIRVEGSDTKPRRSDPWPLGIPELPQL